MSTLDDIERRARALRREVLRLRARLAARCEDMPPFRDRLHWRVSASQWSVGALRSQLQRCYRNADWQRSCDELCGPKGRLP